MKYKQKFINLRLEIKLMQVNYFYIFSGKEKSNHGPPPTQPGVDYVNVGEEDQMVIMPRITFHDILK